MRAHLRSTLAPLVIAIAGAAAACGDDAESTPPASTAGAAGAENGASGGGPGAGAGSAGVGGSTSGAAGQSGDPTVPTTPAALFEWLTARGYEGFQPESKIHASAGPHGGSVRAFLSPSLVQSLASGAAEHPEGVAVVKELYGSGQTLTGWAVAVKTQPTSDAGKGWYWFEVFSTQSAGSALEGQGKSLCVNCHKGGKDHVLTPFPLQLRARSFPIRCV